MWKNGSKKSKILNNRFEPQNVIDQLQEQQKKKGKMVGHLSKGCFTENLFYFTRANHGNACEVNLGDRERLQVSCTL